MLLALDLFGDLLHLNDAIALEILRLELVLLSLHELLVAHEVDLLV